ncbi:DUF3164 family protein [Kiritimatiellaeota bacterium B1221]|nr:DUF3164 family protein [Kiritimatiellaeota bacterium B1221]
MNPHDYMEDAQGNLVHISNVKDVDVLRNDTVMELVLEGQKVAKAAAEFKAKAFAEILSFADLSLEKYGKKWGGKKGNITLTTYNGKYRIMIARQDTIQFTEQLTAAQDLIMECFDEWTVGSRDEVRMLIHEAFKTNKAGQVSTGKVLGLLRLEIKHPKWEKAMDAIRDSIQVAGSAAYIRLYERRDNGDYEQIALDGSGAVEEGGN